MGIGTLDVTDRHPRLGLQPEEPLSTTWRFEILLTPEDHHEVEILMDRCQVMRFTVR